MRCKFFYFVWVGLCIAVFSTATAQPSEPISFSDLGRVNLINPITGNRQKLDLEGRKKMQLFVFLSPECPLCKNYANVLNDIVIRFNKDVDLYGVVPGSTYSNADIKKFTEKYKLTFPVVKDEKKQLTAQFKAGITPEVFLLSATGQLLYKGAIDNWAISLGKQRSVTSQNYLSDAIDHASKGQKIHLPYTTPVGCIINDF